MLLSGKSPCFRSVEKDGFDYYPKNSGFNLTVKLALPVIINVAMISALNSVTDLGLQLRGNSVELLPFNPLAPDSSKLIHFPKLQTNSTTVK